MKHAIVTGGSRGIGRGVTKTLLARGWNVTVFALEQDLDVDRSDLVALDERWPASRLRVAGLDVRDGPTLTEAVRRAEEELGPCAALVTAAGVARPSKFIDLPTAEFRRQMDVNYFGTINSIRAVYQGMCGRRSGRIVLVSSGAGLIGIFGHTAYAPTKFAVRGMGEALRAEAKPHGVSVSVCFLPDTDTPQFRANTDLRPKETSAISSGAGLWSADDVGRVIVDGMEKGRARIAPGQMALLQAFISPLEPILRRRFDAIVDKLATKAGPW